MATTVSSVWNKPNAWALDVEQHQHQLTHLPSATVEPPSSDFPSLSAAITTKPKKKSKQVFSLAEFSSVDVVLPTGPTRRTAEELAALRRPSEVDDWSKGKKFGDQRRDKVKGSPSTFSKADEVDNWAANKDDNRRRDRRVGFDATGPVKSKEGGNTASASGRPRLNLQPRTLPIGNNNINNVSNGNGGEVAEKGKGNPFGAARPREEVLKEKGQDWKEIDQKLDAVKINEVEERRGFGYGGGRGRDDMSGSRTWRKPGPPSEAAATITTTTTARFDSK
ncbi:eukaryotic translation initiation factor 4B3-like [Silene latifolia]|uniref:eukaryotic translation initiation factor 4B3-like n=1 Tax=Silene latifolia TaxID=37657 RepID=UPI003D78A0A9